MTYGGMEEVFLAELRNERKGSGEAKRDAKTLQLYFYNEALRIDY